MNLRPRTGRFSAAWRPGGRHGRQIVRDTVMPIRKIPRTWFVFGVNTPGDDP
jgi:hypothetical protein